MAIVPYAQAPNSVCISRLCLLITLDLERQARGLRACPHQHISGEKPFIQRVFQHQRNKRPR